jgi:aspartate racemase
MSFGKPAGEECIMGLKPAIGVIGGLGPQASALLYKLLVDRTKYHTDLNDTAAYPRIVLISTSIPNHLASGEASDPAVIAAVVEVVQEETRLLEQSGALVNCVACNTAHLALEHLQAVTSVPFLSIMDLMKGAVRDYERPGLLSTVLTKQVGLYADVHPNLFIPDDETLVEAERYVFKLLDDNITNDDVVAFRKFVDDYRVANELDVVLLACTELPVVYGPVADSAVISSLDVLADGLLEYYFAHL